MNRRCPRRAGEAGWSLIELMAALAAFVPMMLGLLALFQGAMEVFVAGSNRLDILQTDRAAIDLVAQHIRSAVFFTSSVPSDNGDVGTPNGREWFQFRGTDGDVNSNDFLGWNAIIYHTDENNADGGDVQYIQVNVATYDAKPDAQYADREALAFRTGAATGAATSKSADARPYPKGPNQGAASPAGPLPPTASPPLTNPATVGAENRLLDNISLFDLDYTTDSRPTSSTTWANTWDAQSSGRLPHLVRLSVRTWSGNQADSVALSTIIRLPLAGNTSIWPNNVRP